jgi:hypothetical protein
MTVTRGTAAAAMLAGLAVDTASVAWTAPTMSGHYTKTTNDPSGRTFTSDWYFTPCGDGCANITITQGGLNSQARLVSGPWTMTLTAPAACSDGTVVPNGETTHYSWDPNTLAGTAQVALGPGACPSDDRSATSKLLFTRA